MGGDFTYQEAGKWFINLDRLIKHVNMKAAQDHMDIKLYYSTPLCYLKAVKQSNITVPTKSDDFFPYSSDPTAFWTGYFSSRPTTKYFERQGNAYLQMVKQLQVLQNLAEHNMFVINELKSAMGIMQHHDAITGTEKQAVAQDYVKVLDQGIEDALLVARQAFSKMIQKTTEEPPLLSFDRCHFNESRCHTSENSDAFIVTVYNPLGWKQSAIPVRIPVTEGNYTVVAPNGDAIDIQVIPLPESVLEIPTRHSNATHEVVFIAKNVQPLGMKAFYVKKHKKDNKVLKRSVDGDYKLYEDVESNEDKIHNKKNIEKDNYYDFYTNVNNYWKEVKDQSYDDIKKIEKASYKSPRYTLNHHKEQMDHTSAKTVTMTSERIPDNELPKKYSLNGKVFDQFADLNVMMDHKEDTYSGDITALQALLKSAHRHLNVSESKTKSLIEKSKVLDPLSDEEMRMLGDQPPTQIVEKFDDYDYLENEYLKLRIEKDSGEITHVLFPDGAETNFGIQVMYYPACLGDNYNGNRSSGAYIFRPNATTAYEIQQNNSKTFKGPVVQEIHYSTDGYVSGVVRLYEGLDFIEHEWLVGSIPIDDGIGKEVIVRYVSKIVNNGEFYTDSNGRQMLKRKLNERPQYDVHLVEPIAGNYYPVTNKIYIEDFKERLAVITDRSEGGSSLIEGMVELMLHRRLLHDDAFGVGEALNETVNNKGLQVRGKHRIVMQANTENGPADKQKIIKEKKSVIEMDLQPILFVSNAKDIDLEKFLTLTNHYSGLTSPLQDGLHLLTLEPWDDSKLLIRIENYLEKSDAEETTLEIDLENLFNNIKVKAIKETMLAANLYMTEHESWTWKVDDKSSIELNFEPPKPLKKDNTKNKDDGLNIKIKAKQIRTFIVNFEYVN